MIQRNLFSDLNKLVPSLLYDEEKVDTLLFIKYKWHMPKKETKSIVRVVGYQSIIDTSRSTSCDPNQPPIDSHVTPSAAQKIRTQLLSQTYLFATLLEAIEDLPGRR